MCSGIPGLSDKRPAPNTRAGGPVAPVRGPALPPPPPPQAPPRGIAPIPLATDPQGQAIYNPSVAYFWQGYQTAAANQKELFKREARRSERIAQTAAKSTADSVLAALVSAFGTISGTQARAGPVITTRSDSASTLF